MKIASNTPASFNTKEGYEFVRMGEVFDGVSTLILMLEKNWGSNSIDKIKALTYYVSAYPKEIPCYLIGCESTIPDLNLKAYINKERDDAIRNLCKEVLKRSVSIGVRGQITYLYLTEILGFDKSQIDVIFDLGKPKNLNVFFKKNKIPIDIEKSASEFQIYPKVLYERAIKFEKNLIIQKPYITFIDNVARLNADILIDDTIKTLWIETDKNYSDYLLLERADAFVCALLPFAIRTGKDIVCEAPVTEQFLHNLNEILIPQLCIHDERLYHTKIFADSDSSILICGNAVATGISCGVDSFYTVSLYMASNFKTMNLTHLYCGNYLYGNHGLIYERAKSASQDLNLPLIRTATNINEALNLPHLYTHFFKTMFGVLGLRKMFRIYYYSTAEDFSHFQLKDNSIRDTAETELLLLYVFTCTDFQLVTGGAKSERLEKTKAISEFAVAKKYLNVCLYPEKEINCGKCEKCRRTLLMLDMHNALDLFRNVFNIDDYHQDRLNSFVYLITQKNSIMLSEVYKHYLKAEPLLIKQAENIVNQKS